MGTLGGLKEHIYLPANSKLFENRDHVCFVDSQEVIFYLSLFVFVVFDLGLKRWVGVSQAEKEEKHSKQRDNPNKGMVPCMVYGD